jgi:hypothetical protein
MYIFSVDAYEYHTPAEAAKPGCRRLRRFLIYIAAIVVRWAALFVVVWALIKVVG